MTENPLPHPPLGGAFGPHRLLVPPPPGARHAHLGWPKAAVAPDGTVVLAYSAGRFHGNHGEGCPAVSLSADGGETFSPPDILMNFDAATPLTNSANTALGVAEDGAFVLLAMGYRGDEANSVFGWRSEDGGRAWAPVDTSALADNRTGSVYGRVFPVPGRGLAVAGHYRASAGRARQGIWLAFSPDNGRTWGGPEEITDGPFVEPCFLFAEGRLLGLLRVHPKQAAYWQAVSDDLGKTWHVGESSLRLEDDGLNFPSPSMVAPPERPGQLLAFQTQRAVPGSTPGAIRLWTAGIGDLGWQPGELVAEFPRVPGDPNTDFGYPWAVPVGGGKWLLAFYFGRKDGPAGIWGTVFRCP